tara:strand:+ start:173 stop:394 length:222 start_codon:yes stop_codon:yes gene_type:complete
MARPFKVNPEYNYFVFNLEHDIIGAGNEYKEDALDILDEVNDLEPCWKVYSSHYLIRRGIDPYNSQNWGQLWA